MRYRVNLSVKPQMQADLAHIVRAYGFRNVQELIVTLLRQFISTSRLAEMKQRLAQAEQETDAAAYIEQMFNELAASEPMPGNQPPPRRKHHKDIQ